MPSASTSLSISASDEFTRADIVFSGVDHSASSFEARVFLNNTDADASTPLDPEQGYSGSFYVFGHGGCFGDEGHCEVPTGPVSEFDRRRAHQLTPATKTVVATDSVRRVLESKSGPGKVKVTVVPVVRTKGRSGYSEVKELLKYERVSIITYE